MIFAAFSKKTMLVTSSYEQNLYFVHYLMHVYKYQALYIKFSKIIAVRYKSL